MCWIHLYNYTSLCVSLVYLLLLCCLYLFPKWHIHFHCLINSQWKAITLHGEPWPTCQHFLYTMTVQLTLELCMWVYVCVCVWGGERMKDTVEGSESETVAGVRISNGTRLGTFFWVLSSWVKGEDAWGQPRHLSFSPSPSLSSSVGSKWSVACETRRYHHLSSSLPASLMQPRSVY